MLLAHNVVGGHELASEEQLAVAKAIGTIALGAPLIEKSQALLAELCLAGAKSLLNAKLLHVVGRLKARLCRASLAQ